MKKTFILVTTALAFILGSSNNVNAQTDELVRVFRWWNPEDNEYVTVAEDEYQDGQLLNWKWTMKTQIFVAYRNPGPGRVAVYSWFNPVTKDHVSIAEDEYTDDQMLKMGYTSKHIQFYALTRRGPNTVAVYRWRVSKHKDWVTVADDADTDVYLKKDFRHKTFQYFGISRSSDAYIYNQLDK